MVEKSLAYNWYINSFTHPFLLFKMQYFSGFSETYMKNQKICTIKVEY